MEEKRPIDRKRDSAGTAEIGTKEDGAITSTMKIGERLFFIKERSIYEFVMADDVDPNRTNIDLPNNMHKLIATQGSDSEIIGRTILTAKRLFQKELFPAELNINHALELTLELVQELIVFDDEVKSYLEQETKVIDEYEERKGEKLSFIIPSISNVHTRCKTIFQKADHISQILMEIIIIFNPGTSLNKQSQFINLHEIFKTKYVENDSFTKFIEDTLEFFEIIRGLRNCLDHRLKNVDVKDFEIQVNSNIISPTIEMDYRKAKLEREALSSFLPMVKENLMTIFENTIAYLADRGVLKQRIVSGQVRLVPEEMRINKFIKFSYWLPLGEGGFYDQK
ncbi:hypothetical protein [Flavobacterium sp.]|uniref:hypothetical protein n=1 Tax=Flavobacterium sp. TaxID=239 RepID=UPI003D6BE755